jgi:hypothetical protein
VIEYRHLGDAKLSADAGCMSDTVVLFVSARWIIREEHICV